MGDDANAVQKDLDRIVLQISALENEIRHNDSKVHELKAVAKQWRKNGDRDQADDLDRTRKQVEQEITADAVTLCRLERDRGLLKVRLRNLRR